MESFGARLRRRREEQGIDLCSVAEQTKLKSSLLAALERDDLSHWPSGFFRRAFVRAYADAIGLNPDVVVREFLEAHPEPAESIEPPPPSGPAPTRFRGIVDSAVGSLSRWRRPAAPAAPVAPTIVDAKPPTRSTPASPEPDFHAVARLCTQLARGRSADDVQPLLREAAGILDATGLIVWAWDAPTTTLLPAMAYGYTHRILAQMPAVTRDASNATAAAFRSGQTCAISAGDRGRGALVVPLMTSWGCAGVLAIELPPGSEQTSSVQAVATIFAAQLAQFIAARPAAASVANVEMADTLHLASALADGSRNFSPQAPAMSSP